MTIEKDIVNLPYNYPVRIHHLHEARRAVSLTHEIVPHANANDPRQISAIAIKGYPCTYINIVNIFKCLLLVHISLLSFIFIILFLMRFNSLVMKPPDCISCQKKGYAIR